MTDFEHLRHKPFTQRDKDRPMIVACAPMRSNVNISTIARTASASGIKHMIITGNAKLIGKIARDGADNLEIETRNSLPPVLKKLKAEGYRIIGLEQTTHSHNMHDYSFPEKCVLVVGNERTGLTEDLLKMLDDAVEIPVYGMPHSFNAATATSMAIYEYCRQYP